MTSCFVYKVMGLAFHDRINTQLIYRFELAQVVARRITRPQRIFLGSNLTRCPFFRFFIFFFGGGGGEGGLILLFASCLIFSFDFFFIIIFLSFIPITCIRNTWNNTNYCKFGNMHGIINKKIT